MNVLVIHSAQSKIIKELINKIKSSEDIKIEKIYILTFKKNKGLFAKYGEEIYFKNNDIRINAFKVKKELKNILIQNDIGYLAAAYSNVYGSNYENLRVLFSFVNVKKKQIFNQRLEKVKYTAGINEKIIEFFYSYEFKLLPIISKFCSIYRLFFKKSQRDIKKIMFINETYAVGGVEKLIYKWGEKLSEKYIVSCVCDTNGGLFKKYLESNIKTHVNRTDVYEETCDFGFYYFLKKIIKIEKPDVVIIAGVNSLFPAVLASVIRGVPKIIKMNNGRFQRIQNSRPFGLQLKLFSSLFSSIIAICEDVKENIIELGVRKELISVVYGSHIDVNNIKLDNCVPGGIDPTKKNITCICRLVPEKGIDIFLKAIKELDRANLEQCNFNIVGNGLEKNNLIDLCNKLQISNYVKFLGYRKDVNEIINESYFTVLSSHVEGMPLVILETMALSKICIASDVCGNHEVIINNENGFLFSDGDYEQLACLMSYAINNEKLIEEMGKNAKNKIIEKFDIKTVVDELINVIKK